MPGNPAPFLLGTFTSLLGVSTSTVQITPMLGTCWLGALESILSSLSCSRSGLLPSRFHKCIENFTWFFCSPQNWKKFGNSEFDAPGPNVATTTVSDDVFMTFITSKEVSGSGGEGYTSGKDNKQRFPDVRVWQRDKAGLGSFVCCLTGESGKKNWRLVVVWTVRFFRHSFLPSSPLLGLELPRGRGPYE